MSGVAGAEAVADDRELQYHWSVWASILLFRLVGFKNSRHRIKKPKERAIHINVWARPNWEVSVLERCIISSIWLHFSIFLVGKYFHVFYNVAIKNDNGNNFPCSWIDFYDQFHTDSLFVLFGTSWGISYVDVCIARYFGFLILWRLFLKPTRLDNKIEIQADRW